MQSGVGNYYYYYYYLLRPKAAQHNITITKKTVEKHKKLKTKIHKSYSPCRTLFPISLFSLSIPLLPKLSLLLFLRPFFPSPRRLSSFSFSPFRIQYWLRKEETSPKRLTYRALSTSGGFRHVQHVRPNRGPTKRGPYQCKKCFFFIFLQHGNKPEILK